MAGDVRIFIVPLCVTVVPRCAPLSSTTAPSVLACYRANEKEVASAHVACQLDTSLEYEVRGSYLTNRFLGGDNDTEAAFELQVDCMSTCSFIDVKKVLSQQTYYYSYGA